MCGSIRCVHYWHMLKCIIDIKISFCGQGDIVLVGLRDFQEGKADIIHKYTAEEARNLQSYGELPATARINQTAIDMALEGGEEEDMGFDFDEVISCNPFSSFIVFCMFPVQLRIQLPY